MIVLELYSRQRLIHALSVSASDEVPARLIWNIRNPQPEHLELVLDSDSRAKFFQILEVTEPAGPVFNMRPGLPTAR